MNFIKMLVETEESKRFKELNISDSPFPNMKFRQFKGIELPNGVTLSVQASFANYCKPRETLPLEDYTHMEIALFNSDGFISVEEATNNSFLIKALSQYHDGTVYGYVPVGLIDKLYEELKSN